MYEVTQRIFTMQLEEFKKWEVPNGWKLMYMSGEEKLGWPGSMDRYFEIRVIMEKEK